MSEQAPRNTAMNERKHETGKAAVNYTGANIEEVHSVLDSALGVNGEKDINGDLLTKGEIVITNLTYPLRALLAEHNKASSEVQVADSGL